MTYRLVFAALVVSALVGVASASAADNWVTPPTNVGAPVNVQFMGTAMNSRGDMAVAYMDPATSQILESDRPAGGTFSTPAVVSPLLDQGWGSFGIDDTGMVYVFFGTGVGANNTSTPRVGMKQVGTSTWTVTPLQAASASTPVSAALGAVSPNGNAMAIWSILLNPNAGAQTTKWVFATKAAGSSTWSAQHDIAGVCGCGSASAIPSSLNLAINNNGDAALVSTHYDGGFNQRMVFGGTLTHGLTTWTTPSQISVYGAANSIDSVINVAIADTGDATAVWTRSNTAHDVVQFATKTLAASSWPQAPAGTTSTNGANDLSPFGADASQPVLAVTPGGRTTIAWPQNGVMKESTRPASGGSFSAAATLPDTLTSDFNPAIATNAAGEFALMWQGQQSAHNHVGGALRPAGSSTWTALPGVPGADNAFPFSTSGVGIDDQGNLGTAWLSGAAGPYQIQATGFDAGPPTISGVSFPATATAGTEFPYSATVTDRWSPVTSSWAFGDGVTGPASGTHTFGTAGSYLALLTATDPFGHSATSSQAVQVATAPPAAGAGAGGGAGAPAVTPTGPTAAPVISAFTLSPATFAAASGGASLAKAKIGTTLKYKVSDQSTTKFTVKRQLKGVKKGKRCVAPPKRHSKKKAKSCTRFATVGSFTHADAAAGNVSVKFTGRVNGHKLAPGHYRMLAAGSNSKGNGKAVKAPFKIVKK